MQEHRQATTRSLNHSSDLPRKILKKLRHGTWTLPPEPSYRPVSANHEPHPYTRDHRADSPSARPQPHVSLGVCVPSGPAMGPTRPCLMTSATRRSGAVRVVRTCNGITETLRVGRETAADVQGCPWHRTSIARCGNGPAPLAGLPFGLRRVMRGGTRSRSGVVRGRHHSLVLRERGRSLPATARMISRPDRRSASVEVPVSATHHHVACRQSSRV